MAAMKMDTSTLDPLYFADAEELRQWFQEFHEQEKELYIRFYKKGSGKRSVTYDEAVITALCFGWIDGVRHALDAESYCNRFTPRKKKSGWSEININRAKELITAGLMHPAGKKAFEAREPVAAAVASRLSPELEALFQEQRKAWDTFKSMSLSYQKNAQRWVMSAKQEGTRLKRLQELIRDSAAGLRIRLLR